MRPVYGIVFLVIYVLSSQLYAKYFKYLLIFVAAIFVIFSVIIYIDYDFFNLYWDFFEYRNLRGKKVVGVMMFSVAEFDQVHSALNFLLSPVYFWYVPPKGFGRVYDIVLLLENIIFLCLTMMGAVRFSNKKIRLNRLYRMSILALLLSFFMAAVTTGHPDVYRFRLIFIPFLFYFATAGLAIRFGSRMRKVAHPATEELVQ